MSPAETQAFTVRRLDPVGDGPVIHSWVTQDRARFWGMQDHSLERVVEIYEHLDGLDTHHAFLVELDGSPVALLQTYWPEHDELGDHYDVQPGDLGVHLLIGPPEGEQHEGFTSGLIGALADFVLADAAVRRLVAEPDALNDKAIARVVRTGFTLGPVVQLPHKQAQLVFIDREVLQP